MKTTWTVFAVVMFASLLHAKDVNVKDLGATGDGKTLDTAAVQKAIDEVTDSGGGKVTVPAGTYLLGTIILKDNVTLHLADGATLLGTADLAQYRNLDPFKDGLGADVGTAFVTVIDAKNVTIEGNGTFDGNNKAVAAAKSFKGEGWGFRPMLLRVVRSSDVTIKDVTFRASASWTTNYFQCKNVTIENVTIDSRGVPHNDGINIDSCEDFTVKNCGVDSGDDALVLKSTSAKPTRNITATGLKLKSGDDALCLKSTSGTPCTNVTATRCRLKSNQGAIKLGTESYGGFENIRISDCQIRDTRNGGIKVLCVDGGTLKDVIISDITMENTGVPIFVRQGARLKTFRPGDTQKPPGVLRDVTIRNIKATTHPTPKLMPPTGVFITGIADHPIENLTLENIEISLPGGGTSEHVRVAVDEKPDTYPEIDRFGKTLPAWGVFARHVNGLTMKNVKLTTDAPDLRPALVAQNVQGLKIDDWQVKATPDADCVIRLESSKDAKLGDVKLDEETKQVVKIEPAQ
jgi:hypothetical protein